MISKNSGESSSEFFCRRRGKSEPDQELFYNKKDDRRAVNEYLTLIDEKELPLNLFEIIDIEDRFPVERVNKLLNDKE